MPHPNPGKNGTIGESHSSCSNSLCGGVGKGELGEKEEVAWTLSHFSISSSTVIIDVGEGRQRDKIRQLVLRSKLRTFRGRVGKRTFLTLQPAKLFDLTTGNQTT